MPHHSHSLPFSRHRQQPTQSQSCLDGAAYWTPTHSCVSCCIVWSCIARYRRHSTRRAQLRRSKGIRQARHDRSESSKTRSTRSRYSWTRASRKRRSDSQPCTIVWCDSFHFVFAVARRVPCLTSYRGLLLSPHLMFSF